MADVVLVKDLSFRFLGLSVSVFQQPLDGRSYLAWLPSQQWEWCSANILMLLWGQAGTAGTQNSELGTQNSELLPTARSAIEQNLLQS
ncbi:hypothetical protein AOXY_G31701 [Acipenser oxyrinchus oxyrinchus]|uniref:Uncharacterized protein n=1 Tax=Acipenser oxyrinchus oxyrinchus TaxID=40147 RepID=A0AAD8FQR5_ACIOX|nr:hypothetical protein AOXY_G31701 [Acipenser oxyrinchus oxyrinchus]